jgi:two-component system nitrogen regulation response regulator GlnG
VGGNEAIESDVRVLAATHRNLEAMVADGQFREDLVYRLNGYTIQLPPLRARGDDLELLVDHFRRQANQDLGKDVRGVAPEAMTALRNYDWPGNVRELQNVIRQAVLKTTGPVLLVDFLPESIVDEGGQPAQREATAGAVSRLIDAALQRGSTRVYDDVVAAVEGELVRRALHHTGGDKLEAIKRLGANPTTFRSPAALELLDVDRPSTADSGDTGLFGPGMTMDAIEREAIRRALERSDGHRARAAESLGVSVRTLQRKIKEYGL